MTRNLVSHAQEGTADKIYMYCIRELPGGTFQVVGKWGRRGRVPKEQVKAAFNNESDAMAEARSLHADRVRDHKDNYVDIEDPDYVGPLTRESSDVRDYFEPEGTTSPVSDPPPSTAPEDRDFEAGDEIIVTCIDNTGIEEGFDAGQEYVAEKHEDDDMIYVYDRFGEKQGCFCERFVVGSPDDESVFAKLHPGKNKITVMGGLDFRKHF